MERYLDQWALRKINEDAAAKGKAQSRELTGKLLEEFQLEKLRETFETAVKCSPFFREKYEGCSFRSFDEFRKLPFTGPKDLQERGLDWLCVSQSEISRIVTLETSGTVGNPKRVFFTEEDQELTVDFFHEGLKLMAHAGDTLMILMPCRMPGSIGDLLKTAAERLEMTAVPYGLPRPDLADSREILRLMEEKKVTCVVALATQMAEICRYAGEYDIPVRTVLLSAEYVSAENRELIGKTWDCRIFEHYGMTEMGLGGAVTCGMLDGCHIREADLYVEIIDPETGETVPDGEYGEIVFSTLTRKGMPFLRYRTGDFSRKMEKPCRCGSLLGRLDRVGDRGMEKGNSKKC